MTGAIQDLGWMVIRFVEQLGQLALFAAQILRAIVTPPPRVRLFIDELFNLGVLSLVIICVCGTAVGMVLFNRVDQSRFRRVVFAILFGSGVVLLTRG